MSPNQKKNQGRLTIVLAGGGSGGHITPLLPLAQELKHSPSVEKVIYIGLKGEKVGGFKQKFSVFDEIYEVSSGKFRRYYGQNWLARLLDIRTWLLNIRDLFRVCRGYFIAKRHLKKIQPNVVFSKGGYGAVPVGMAAKMLNIPIVTHDSDAVPGLANRIVGRWAKVHATGMPAKYYKYPKSSIQYVGVPVDPAVGPVGETERQEFKKSLRVPPDCLLLLVTGGGLGAQKLNELIMSAAKKLLTEMPNLYIAHLCGLKIRGQQGEEEIRALYQRQLPVDALNRVILHSFTDKFNVFTGAADLVVSRAGATTIAELAAQKKAAIIIPNPHLTGGHQTQNAEALKEQGAVEVLPNSINADDFSQEVLKLLRDPAARRQLADRLGQTYKKDAVKLLAQIIIKVGRDEI